MESEPDFESILSSRSQNRSHQKLVDPAATLKKVLLQIRHIIGSDERDGVGVGTNRRVDSVASFPSSQHIFRASQCAATGAGVRQAFLFEHKFLL